MDTKHIKKNNEIVNFYMLYIMLKDNVNAKLKKYELFEKIFSDKASKDLKIPRKTKAYEIINGKSLPEKSFFKTYEKLIRNNNKGELRLNEKKYLENLSELFNVNFCEKVYDDKIRNIKIKDSDKENLSLSYRKINDNQYHLDFVLRMILLFLDFNSYKSRISNENRKDHIFSDVIDVSCKGNSKYKTGKLAEDAAEYFKQMMKYGTGRKMGIRMMQSMANKGNAFGCFEMANMEADGDVVGKPRYEKCYYYLIKAARKKHPLAIWSLGYLRYWNYYNQGLTGTKHKQNYGVAMRYFKIAEKMECAAAINSIGVAYLEGHAEVGKDKDFSRAKEYFEKAAKMDYFFAMNNLGKLYELTWKEAAKHLESNLNKDLNDESPKFKDLFKSDNYISNMELNNYIFMYQKKGLIEFEKSAKSHDSWAANRVGWYYYEGYGTPNNKKDPDHAKQYFELSISAPPKTRCKWALYNYANNYLINVKSKIFDDNAIKYLEEAASSNNIFGGVIEASMKLVEIYHHNYKDAKTEKDRNTAEYNLFDHLNLILESNKLDEKTKTKYRKMKNMLEDIV